MNLEMPNNSEEKEKEDGEKLAFDGEAPITEEEAEELRRLLQRPKDTLDS